MGGDLKNNKGLRKSEESGIIHESVQTARRGLNGTSSMSRRLGLTAFWEHHFGRMQSSVKADTQYQVHSYSQVKIARHEFSSFKLRRLSWDKGLAVGSKALGLYAQGHLKKGEKEMWSSCAKIQEGQNTFWNFEWPRHCETFFSDIQ